MRRRSFLVGASGSALLLSSNLASARRPRDRSHPKMRHETIRVEGLRIFYREAGPPEAPVILALHGFPTSSHMFRDLLPALADRYRVIAPDYPGYGYSEAPSADAFRYTFDNLARMVQAFVDARGLQRYALYLQDFGGPIGFRLATARPTQVSALIVQNANAYEDGFSEAMHAIKPAWTTRTRATEEGFRNILAPQAVKEQWVAGEPDPALISPDAWMHAVERLKRPGNDLVQLAMLHDYGSNAALYPSWQDYFRRSRPRTLIAWGVGDPFFTEAGARAYLRDLPDAQLHLLNAGHFALETQGPEIAALIRRFLD